MYDISVIKYAFDNMFKFVYNTFKNYKDTTNYPLNI